ncbi:hypothetical protein PbB2_01764 [Candidatus Phycosocius bacilliformis]|uniref:COQ9 domain-containing protein n=1 Tax=Candidatus Phycosocius bacilliformis TaxID=1445552 RepID=A0A2P2EAM6_9PROT|nr:hypothetical protein [Candidatus Phycosocius bacilliformis]GBF58093.1 hypothetical protein PbB2_01764 [Candidatus Phycosocius bacilliformis]
MHTRPSDLELLSQLARAALDLSAQRAWEQISLFDLCNASELSLDACAAAGIGKQAIADRLDHDLDLVMLKAAKGVEAGASHHDRLFEIVMARFDGLEDARPSWMSILHGDGQEPATRLARSARRLRTAAWALEACGVSTDQLMSTARILGLARRLSQVENVWMRDGGDLSKTMAALDQTLRDHADWVQRGTRLGERLSALFKRPSHRQPHADTKASEV